MATIVSALLQTSQDWDSGVPEHLQSLESSVAAQSESEAVQQGLARQRVHVVVSMAKSSPGQLCSAASHRLHRRKSEASCFSPARSSSTIVERAM